MATIRDSHYVPKLYFYLSNGNAMPSEISEIKFELQQIKIEWKLCSFTLKCIAFVHCTNTSDDSGQRGRIHKITLTKPLRLTGVVITLIFSHFTVDQHTDIMLGQWHFKSYLENVQYLTVTSCSVTTRVFPSANPGEQLSTSTNRVFLSFCCHLHNIIITSKDAAKKEDSC